MSITRRIEVKHDRVAKPRLPLLVSFSKELRDRLSKRIPPPLTLVDHRLLADGPRRTPDRDKDTDDSGDTRGKHCRRTDRVPKIGHAVLPRWSETGNRAVPASDVNDSDQSRPEIQRSDAEAIERSRACTIFSLVVRYVAPPDNCNSLTRSPPHLDPRCRRHPRPDRRPLALRHAERLDRHSAPPCRDGGAGARRSPGSRCVSRALAWDTRSPV